MVRLGDVCKFQRGLTYKKSDEVAQSDNIVLRSNNIDLEQGALDLRELKCIREDLFVPDDKKVMPGSILMCMANGSKSHLVLTELFLVEEWDENRTECLGQCVEQPVDRGCNCFCVFYNFSSNTMSEFGDMHRTQITTKFNKFIIYKFDGIFTTIIADTHSTGNTVCRTM